MSLPEEVHYVRGSWRNKGYWRKKPYIYRHPTENQRRARSLFIRIAHEEGLNQWGTTEIEVEGEIKTIPKSAEKIRQLMHPVSRPSPPIMVQLGAADLQRLRDILRLREIVTAPL